MVLVASRAPSRRWRRWPPPASPGSGPRRFVLNGGRGLARARRADAAALADGRPAGARRSRAARRARPRGGAPGRPGRGGALASLEVSYGATRVAAGTLVAGIAVGGGRRRPRERAGTASSAPPPLVLHGPRLVATGAGIALSGRGARRAAADPDRAAHPLTLGTRGGTRGEPSRAVRQALRSAACATRCTCSGREPATAGSRASCESGRATLHARRGGTRTSGTGRGTPWPQPGDGLPVGVGRAGPPPRGHRLREPRVRGLGARVAGAEGLQLPRPSGRAQGDGARYAGFDALNLANNHVGDYGRTALLDTVRHVRRRASRPWAPAAPRVGA